MLKNALVVSRYFHMFAVKSVGRTGLARRLEAWEGVASPAFPAGGALRTRLRGVVLLTLIAGAVAVAGGGLLALPVPAPEASALSGAASLPASPLLLADFSPDDASLPSCEEPSIPNKPGSFQQPS